jgi:hypothetical protein
MTPHGFFRVTDILAGKTFPEAMQKERRPEFLAAFKTCVKIQISS